MKLEVACFDLKSATIAADASAHRIEFCDDYSLGGITPNIEDFKKLRSYTSIPIYMMIRPRGGNFVYAPDEVDTMLNSIDEFKKLGADGLVFGCLNTNNELDLEANKILLHEANNLPCTFHRAFDKIENYPSALETLINLGFKNILTSGGKSNALEGIDRLLEVQQLSGNKIDIVCGGGVRSTNIKNIKAKFYTNFYHTSGIVDDSLIANKQEIEQIISLLIS